MIKWSVNCINAEWPQQDKLRYLKFIAWASCIVVFSFSCVGNFAYTSSFQKVLCQKFSIQVPGITIATINPMKLMQNASQCIETVNHIGIKDNDYLWKKNKTKQKQEKSQKKWKSVKYDKNLKATFTIWVAPVWRWSLWRNQTAVWNAKFSEQSGRKKINFLFCSCINVLRDQLS